MAEKMKIKHPKRWSTTDDGKEIRKKQNQTKQKHKRKPQRPVVETDNEIQKDEIEEKDEK